MAKKKTGQALIERVGYANDGTLVLIVRGSSPEVMGATFTLPAGQDVMYNAQEDKLLIGKTVNFTFSAVNDVFRPSGLTFVSVDE